MTDVLMPALSPTMEEGTLAKWLVKTGDKVRAGDVIAEIETDKATMEVEAVDEGVVEQILVPEGTEGVKVNAPIARLMGEGESPSAATPPPTPAAAPEPQVQTGLERRRPAGPPAVTPPLGDAGEAPALRSEPPSIRAKPTSGSRILASPLARRLAAQKRIDLSALKGSGPHGRVIRRDVDEAKPGVAAPAPNPAYTALTPATEAPRLAPAEVPSLEQLGVPPGSYKLVPLDGMRKTVARRLTEAFRDIPHFPLTIDVALDELLAARAKINAVLEPTGVKVSVNDLVIKASAMALIRAPEVNASFTPQGIAFHKHADVAVAVAVESGLITPIIRQAELKGLGAIATEMKDLAERARNRRLKPEEFQGGTFSVSNLGMFGIKSFASILNPPQGAILSVGAGEKRPVVVGDELKIATVMTVTLTCDHRVIGGAEGSKFLIAFKGFIEQPLAMLA